ncbi:MAG: aldehyde ferredoxin oxidoreductase N-terminal domain-containing protein [Anaerolineae bacterium]|jgi:aldehyde:ferredoxin oxidoreductase
MRGVEPRRVLVLEAQQRRFRLRLVESSAEYPLPSGEALCQRLLREDARVLVIARGPLTFLSGNKTTVGYISPLTGLPHYSFVGGRGFAELLNLGLDAVVLSGAAGEAGGIGPDYVVVSGRAPHLSVEWTSAADLPTGQRSAFYWLLERELGGQGERGSIYTVGEGARLGYRTSNLGVDGLYHAGRGGAGAVFARFLAALVLRGEPLAWQERLGSQAERFWELREGEIRRRLEVYTKRLSRRDGGTVTKLHTTGSGERPTLPARNAQQLGYVLADLGASQILRAHRVGQTGCQWCQVNCRHWHWVDADYAPKGRDRLLDDFEPAYALFAMLDLRPEDDSQASRLRLLQEVDQRLLLPIEQMGCDAIDIGVGLAALFEGIERGLVPIEDVPSFLQSGPALGNLDAATQAVAALRDGGSARALQAVGHGPQFLAERYPQLQQILFTSGPGTLGNAGHANKLWTFLMPFSRYFSHYAGQLYKIEGHLPDDPAEAQPVLTQIVGQALQREFFGILCNTLSACAFTFVLFSQEGKGIELDDSDLLVRTLACYGIETSREELAWFAEAFWAQSIAFKLEHGWHPPSVDAYPDRVFEVLSPAVSRPESHLRALMTQLIAEWQRQAGAMLYKYGYPVPEGWT